MNDVGTLGVVGTGSGHGDGGISGLEAASAERGKETPKLT